MYHQIKVHPNNYDIQRVQIRKNSSLPVHEYQLTTVTYGTALAPFLTTKRLQLATEEAINIQKRKKFFSVTFMLLIVFLVLIA